MFKQKRFQVIFILLLLVSYSSICIAAGTLVRDGWNLLEMEGKTVGYNYEQYFQDDDGFYYEVDQTLQMNFLNNPVEVTQHIFLELNQDYTVKSYQITTKTDDMLTEVKATFDNGDINIVSIDPDGKEYKSYWQLAEPVYLTDSYLQYMFEEGTLKPGEKMKVKCWDVGKNQPEDVVISIEEITTFEYNGKIIPGFKVTFDEGDEKVTNLTDWEGQVYYSEYSSQDLRGYKVEKDQIPELDSVAIDVLIVPADVMVTHPYRTTHSQITVKWRDVSFDEFAWEDNRQHLVIHRVTEYGQEVDVQIKKDTRDFTGKIVLPVQAADLEKYLADTDFIHASIPEVRNLVTQIIGEERDAWTVTQKLVDFVYDYINYDAVLKTLTTEEILEGKTGKCSEYAVLFASLARSAGLPTKVVLGERYDSKSWVGHLWNEVWLGEWITVDPSHGQIAPDALLLKFVDSDTVMGTQIVRRGLIGKLDIKINDVKSDTVENEEQQILKTGIQDLTYTNADFRCQISGPEGWQMIEATDQGVPMIVIQTVQPAVVQGIMLMFSVPEGTIADQILQPRLVALGNQLPEFEIIDQQETTLLGLPVSYATFTIRYQGTLLRQQNWVLINGDSGYLFIFGTDDNYWDANDEYFQQIRESFKIID